MGSSEEAKNNGGKKESLRSRMKNPFSKKRHSQSEDSRTQQDGGAAQCTSPKPAGPLRVLSNEETDSEPPPSYDSIANTGASVPSSSNTSPQARRGIWASSRASRGTRQTRVSDDDEYAFLARFDTVFVVDDSGSMRFGSSWDEAKTVLSEIAKVCAKYDDDGLDIYFLNHKSGAIAPTNKGHGGYYGINTAAGVEDIFNQVRPDGLTPTGEALYGIMLPYLAAYEKAAATGQQTSMRPVNIIVITDGAPTDDLPENIRTLARRLDRLYAPPSQVGIQFFQVGNDRRATRALKELDDDLKGNKDDKEEDKVRDMVDTVTWDNRDAKVLMPETVLKTVLGAVHRKLDNKNQASRR